MANVGCMVRLQVTEYISKIVFQRPPKHHTSSVMIKGFFFLERKKNNEKAAKDNVVASKRNGERPLSRAVDGLQTPYVHVVDLLICYI